MRAALGVISCVIETARARGSRMHGTFVHGRRADDRISGDPARCDSFGSRLSFSIN